MDELTLGVVATSHKENEHRLAIHPRHLDRIDPTLRDRIVLERGYAERFGISDADVALYVGGLCSREQLFEDCDVVVLPKPQPEDLAAMRPGQVLWGWPHCVQDRAITQVAIERRLTLIAWEAMHHWTHTGAFSLHVFHKNNELAGYCSVLHALQLVGRSGHYGPRSRAVVISFGATARGAITALYGLGIYDVTVLTHRNVPAVAAPIPPARLVHYERDPDHPARALAIRSHGAQPLAEFLAGHDIVVNCVLQDPNRPEIFVTSRELAHFAPGTVFVDVSCDEGMGFDWARPTTFEAPMFGVGAGLHYYGVDHSPTYLWDSATWEISEALIPHLATVMSGPDAWAADETISRAIEVRDGTIQNPAILAFQARDAAYPHASAERQPV